MRRTCKARQAFLALAQATDAKDVPIGRIENGELPGPAGPLPFRIYTPVAPAAEPLAGLVYFHGGGFVIGNLDTHDGFCRMLANESGCQVISVDYRLAPEHKFPAAVEDAYAATKWVAYVKAADNRWCTKRTCQHRRSTSAYWGGADSMRAATSGSDPKRTPTVAVYRFTTQHSNWTRQWGSTKIRSSAQ